MNGILLVVRMHRDDLPMRMFKDRDELGKYLLNPGGIDADADVVSRRIHWTGSKKSCLVGIEFRDGEAVDSFHVMNL